LRTIRKQYQKTPCSMHFHITNKKIQKAYLFNVSVLCNVICVCHSITWCAHRQIFVNLFFNFLVEKASAEIFLQKHTYILHSPPWTSKQQHLPSLVLWRWGFEIFRCARNFTSTLMSCLYYREKCCEFRAVYMDTGKCVIKKAFAYKIRT